MRLIILLILLSQVSYAQIKSSAVLKQENVCLYATIQGQSGGVGRGLNADATALEIDSNNNVFIYQPDSTFERLWIANNNNLSNAGQHGIELQISNSPIFKEPYYLNKKAASGTSISIWTKGGTSHNFLITEGIVNPINYLLAQPQCANGVYYQFFSMDIGETDSGTQPNIDAFSARVDTLINIVWDLIPGTPIVAKGIIESDSGDVQINDIYAELDTLYSDFKFVREAKDYSSGDDVHLDYYGLKDWGRCVQRESYAINPKGVLISDSLNYVYP